MTVHGVVYGLNMFTFIVNVALSILGFLLTYLNVKRSNKFKQHKPIKVIGIALLVFYGIVIIFSVIYYLSLFGVLIPYASQLGGTYAFLPLCVINTLIFAGLVVCIFLVRPEINKEK
jgi:hypothetical protein